MKSVKTLVPILACIAFVLGVNIDLTTAKDITIKYAAQQPIDHPVCAFPKKLAEIIEKKTNGSVKVRIYPGNTLAGYSLDPIRSGISDMQELVSGMGRDLVPWIQILEIPYFVTARDHFYKVADPRGPVVTEANKVLANHNLTIVGFFNYGTRVLTMNKPVYSPIDLNGAKVRVVPTKIWIESWKAFGASPVPMPATEIQPALLTGAIDGQENSWHEIPGRALWDVQKYVMETDHLMTLSALWMNLKTWESMNPEQKEALQDAVSESRRWYEEDFTESKMREYRKLVVEKGMKIIGTKEGLKKNEFTARGKIVLGMFEKDWGEWPAKIEAMGKVK
jgi:TRAP-type C4-dicarboxylate transport system substrate-binding protein